MNDTERVNASAEERGWQAVREIDSLLKEWLGNARVLPRNQLAAIIREHLEAHAAEQTAALSGLVGCIDTSAADRGPAVTQGSMMAQVCKVLQRTTQYDRARAALAAAPGDATTPSGEPATAVEFNVLDAAEGRNPWNKKPNWRATPGGAT